MSLVHQRGAIVPPRGPIWPKDGDWLGLQLDQASDEATRQSRGRTASKYVVLPFMATWTLFYLHILFFSSNPILNRVNAGLSAAVGSVMIVIDMRIVGCIDLVRCRHLMYGFFCLGLTFAPILNIQADDVSALLPTIGRRSVFVISNTVFQGFTFGQVSLASLLCTLPGFLMYLMKCFLSWGTEMSGVTDGASTGSFEDLSLGPIGWFTLVMACVSLMTCWSMIVAWQASLDTSACDSEQQNCAAPVTTRIGKQSKLDASFSAVIPTAVPAERPEASSIVNSLASVGKMPSPTDQQLLVHATNGDMLFQASLHDATAMTVLQAKDAICKTSRIKSQWQHLSIGNRKLKDGETFGTLPAECLSHVTGLVNVRMSWDLGAFQDFAGTWQLIRQTGRQSQREPLRQVIVDGRGCTDSEGCTWDLEISEDDDCLLLKGSKLFLHHRMLNYAADGGVYYFRRFGEQL